MAFYLSTDIFSQLNYITLRHIEKITFSFLSMRTLLKKCLLQVESNVIKNPQFLHLTQLQYMNDVNITINLFDTMRFEYFALFYTGMRVAMFIFLQ